MSNINISEATIALIDSLKSTTGAFGLAGTGSEYKIVTEMFLYKFFNDKFGYEAKRDQIYGEPLSKAEKWDAESFQLLASFRTSFETGAHSLTLV